MYRLLSAAMVLAALPLTAEWRQYKLGPFEVLADDDEERARDFLNYAVQLRHSLGWQLGNTDFEPAWPLRAVIAERRETPFTTPRLARDAYLMSVRDLTPEAGTALVQFLLEGWPGQLPPTIARGLTQLYTTLKVDGTRVTLGTPPARKDRDWARAHMLAVHPDYSGKLRVLLGNLSRGVDVDTSYKNAFTQSAEEIEKALDRYMQAGQYGTISAPSRPLNARRELIGRPVEDSVGKVARADLLFANGQPGARGAYAALLLNEGLGLIDRNPALLKDAVSARGLVELAGLTGNIEEKRAALTKATAANKRWAEPWRMLAQIEKHPAQRLPALRKVTELEPHIASNWIELARLQEEVQQFAEASKSWASAERATTDPKERRVVQQQRLAGQAKRLEQEIAAREEVRRLAEAEIQAVREKAMMAIRAAEAKANAGKPIIDPKGLGRYAEGGKTQKLSGTLTRVECLGKTANLHVASGKRVVQIRVADPGQVELSGGGQIALTCGAQRAGRKVVVEYMPVAETNAAVSGEAVRVELGR